MIADMKVGELSKRTGVSIRTLHYYHEIGLLSPSHHSHGDHRLYSAADVARLQRIRSLQQLGFSLEEVRECLDRPGFSPLEVVEMHIRCLDEKLERQARLRERLQSLAHGLRAADDPSVVEFLQTIEEMSAMEKYYTPEQLETLRKRRVELGEGAMQKAQDDWMQLIADVRAAMDAGTDPASAEVEPLARRYRALIDAFTGGDQGIEASLGNVYRAEPDAASRRGFAFDAAMGEYLGRAVAALGEGA